NKEAASPRPSKGKANCDLLPLGGAPIIPCGLSLSNQSSHKGCNLEGSLRRKRACKTRKRTQERKDSERLPRMTGCPSPPPAPLGVVFCCATGFWKESPFLEGIP
ncbi:Hypothetical protein NTJ_11544, partial [Nesidiocoris tenuis]